MPDPLPVYAPFGKFQLIARLGKGGMGEVFLALLHGIQGVKKLVVIKRLLDSITEDRPMRELFLEEGRLAARLNHSNVVQTIEVGEEAGALYLSMEYLEGQPLNQVVKKLGTERMDPRLASRIISDVLCGLHYAHELKDYDGRPLNIVHRDMSPHNIFITYEGEVKIFDFGIAKAASQANKTEVGILKGKVAYMAPEQATSDNIDRRADIFVIGIVLWELLTGTRLFAGEMKKTFFRLLQQSVPAVSTVVPEIDPELDAIVSKALFKDPNARFASAKEMRDALDGYIAKSGRPVRAEDLGEVLGRLFAKRREQVRRQVRTYMSAVEAAHSTTELPTLTTTRQGVGEGSSSALSAPSDALLASGTREVAGPEIEMGRSVWTGRRLQVAVVAAALCAGLASFVVARSLHSPPAAPPTVSEPPKAAIQLAPVPVVAPTAEPAPVVASPPDSVSTTTARAGKAARGPFVARVVGTPAEVSAPAQSPTQVGASVARPSAAPDTVTSSAAAPNKRKYRLDF
jgi:serine/threonine-protein kinase